MNRIRDGYTEAHMDYYALVFSVVNTKVDNVEDAKDITQDVFIKFYEKFESINNIRKWLYGALRISVLEHYRKKRGSDLTVEDIFEDSSIAFVNGFRDARVVIDEAFEDINIFSEDEDKILFDLIAVHNFSYSKTGEQLGFTKRQVQYKYGSIVKKIMHNLNEKGIKHIEDLL